MNSFIETVKEFFGGALITVLTGLIAAVLGLLIVRLLKRLLRRLLTRLPINATVSTFLLSIISAVLYIIYTLVVLDAFGIPMTGFIALLSSVGVAVGLALKDSLSNIANGIMLVIMKPFKVGDFISVNGVDGVVVGIHMISTVIQTTDNKVITIPNNEVLSNNITNFNGMTTRRLDMVFTVAYGSDIDKVKEIFLDLTNKHEPRNLVMILLVHLNGKLEQDPLKSYHVWVKADEYWNVKWDLNEQSIKALAEANIEIPYNKLDVNVYKGE